MDPVEAKAAMRTQFRQQRRERQTDESSADDIAKNITDHICDLEPIREACEQGLPIACYSARAGEPPTDILRAALRADGATVLLPRVEGAGLVWCADDDQTPMAKNAMGIFEPTTEPVDTQPAAWIIPALAIDEDGYRLGQGGGFYDRTLAGLAADRRGPIVAVVFEDEVVSEVPREDHDQPVDIVVTPERVRWLAMPD